jgi:hypothetical protein
LEVSWLAASRLIEFKERALLRTFVGPRRTRLRVPPALVPLSSTVSSAKSIRTGFYSTRNGLDAQRTLARRTSLVSRFEAPRLAGRVDHEFGEQFSKPGALALRHEASGSIVACASITFASHAR